MNVKLKKMADSSLKCNTRIQLASATGNTERKNRGFKCLLQKDSLMMKKLVIIFLIFFSGCYSPKLIKESDLYLSEYVLEAHYLEVYQRLVKGFNICRENPFESHIDEEKKEADISVYEKNPGLGRNKPLKGIGWIQIKFRSKFLTDVHFGARRFYEEKYLGKERALTKRWLRWAQGATVRSCEDSQFPDARQKLLQQQ